MFLCCIPNQHSKAYRLFSQLSKASTMFSLRMPFDSAFLSRALSSRKVSLFDGMVFGMILMVFLIGSVQIFSILERRFSFCLTIQFSTTAVSKGLHLWYLFNLLEREKEGRHGCQILMPGLIFLRLWMCFWQDRTWVLRGCTFIFWETTLLGSESCHISKIIFSIYDVITGDDHFHSDKGKLVGVEVWGRENGQGMVLMRMVAPSLAFVPIHTEKKLIHPMLNAIQKLSKSYFLFAHNIIPLKAYQPAMNFIGKLQKQYDQLWKYIIRPARTPYAEQSLGPSVFTIKGKEFHRKDFQLSNKRGYDFSCSLWLPVDLEEYPCVIYLHGNSSNRLQGTEYLRRLLINKMALCTFDFSGCGNAEGEYISLGYYQQEDLREVVEYLKNYPKIKNIALWGRSMGAVTALLYLAKNQSEVKAAVFDSPFKSLKALVEEMAQKNSKIPKIVLNAALKIISGTIKEKAGFSIYDLNPMKNAVGKLQIPAFFVVGIQDQIIPIQHTKDLFQLYAGDDRIIKMIKGSHNDNRPKECIREIVRFLMARFNKQNQKKASPKKIEQQVKEEKSIEVATVDVEKVEQSIKKGEFSWSSLFNVFQKDTNKLNNDPQPQKSSPLLNSDKKIEHPQKFTRPKKQKKPPSTPEQAKALAEQKLQDSMRQYTYCFL